VSEPRKIPMTQPPTRMVARGIDFADYAKMQLRVDKGEDYVAVAEQMADRFATLAGNALQDGHRLTAKTLYLKAAALYRVAPYGILSYTEEKTRLYKKELDAFTWGMHLQEGMEIEKVEIPYKESMMCGWLLKPKDATNQTPVVIATGGLTGFKEEVHYVIEAFVERGMAVLNMDGPGQGESFFHHDCLLETHSEFAQEAMVDYVLGRPDLGNTMALYGLCMGGYTMARAAAHLGDRVAACVSMGGAYDMLDAISFHPAFYKIGALRAGFIDKQSETIDEAIMERIRAFALQLNLKGYAERITCPLFVVHNTPDPLIPSSNVKQLFDLAPTRDKKLVSYPGPDHNAHADNTEATALVGDWLAERLIVKPVHSNAIRIGEGLIGTGTRN